MKTCNCCNTTKKLIEFHRSARYIDGHCGDCKVCRSKKEKARYLKDSDKIKANRKSYYYENKKTVLATNLIWQTKTLKTNPTYKLKRNLRNRLYYALKNKMWKKRTSFSKYIGLENYEDLKLYISKQFTNEMTWDNYGKVWEIDHIKPLSIAVTPEEMYVLCHYTNLQPMIVSENRSKSNKT